MLSHFSHVQLFVTLWTAAYQAPLSMGFSRQEYWSGVPLPSPKRTLLHDNACGIQDSMVLAQKQKYRPMEQDREPIDAVQSLGQEDPLEEGMTTHSSILAWRTPWTLWHPMDCSLPGSSVHGTREGHIKFTIAYNFHSASVTFSYLCSL